MKKNQSGFSVMELIIASSLFSILMIGTLSAMFSIAQRQTKIIQLSSDDVDTAVAERTLILDFKNLEPSFNTRVVADDQCFAQKFFDYYPDVPSALIQVKTRKVVMSMDDKISRCREFHFLAVDGRSGTTPIVIYDPLAAYITIPQDNPSVEGQVTYAALNRNSWISRQANFWKDGQLILLDTAARYRPKAPPDIPIHMQPAPRSPTFVGVVKGADAKFDINLRKWINFSAPWNPALRMESPNDFLRNLRPVSGGQPIVRVRAVRLLNYYLQPGHEEGKGGITGAHLYRRYYLGDGRFSDPFLMATNVESVSFLRNDITKKSIGFTIKKMPIK